MSTRTGYDESMKGVEVTNQPSHEGLMLFTGNYEINHYGCWWEYSVALANDCYWMIGEYPEGAAGKDANSVEQHRVINLNLVHSIVYTDENTN